MKALKQWAQAIAKPIFRQIEKDLPVTAEQSTRARFHGAVAQGAKGELERIPRVETAEREVQRLIGEDVRSGTPNTRGSRPNENCSGFRCPRSGRR